MVALFGVWARIFNINMPVMNGIEVAKNFSRFCPGVTLLATSTEPKHSYYVKEMLDAGAHALLARSATRVM